MKKLFELLLCSLSFMTVAWSCGHDDEGITPVTIQDENTPNDNGDSTDPNGSATDSTSGSERTKLLIVYFSRAGENWNVGYVDRGNTAVMADYIKELTGGDVFEITPQTPYPSNYEEMLEVCRQEIANNARPAIKDTLSNIDDYSTIFIGSPIWSGRPPMIMRTFYENYPQLATKTLIPFGTHAGSGISSCTTLIREYLPNATILESCGISGDQIRNAQSRNNVKEWLQRIGISMVQ